MKIKILAALLLCLGSFSAVAEMSCDNVEQTTVKQCEVLKKLWQQTGGHSWSDAQTNGWMQSNNPCSWEGVTCWGANVVRIVRGNKNLVGQLPDLGDLHNLRTLDVHTNQLTGQVPDLSKNTKLEDLYIFKNDFTGLLPDLTKTPNLQRFYIFSNPMLIGPLTFGGHDNASLPVISGTSLCRSRKIDYKHWSETVSSLPLCEGWNVPTDLQYWGVLPDDGKDDSHGLNHLLAMRYFDQGEYGMSAQIQFDNGVYELDGQIQIHNMQDVELKGVYGYGNLEPENLYQPVSGMGTVFKKSDNYVLLWDKQAGAMLSIFGSNNVKINSIAFFGKTVDMQANNSKDHGVVNVNSMGTTINDSAFAHFGGSAITDFAVEQDMSGYVNPEPESIGTSVEYNVMNNICQITTAGNWYGSRALKIDYNKIANLKCSLQLLSAKHIADSYSDPEQPTLQVTNNMITGPGATYSGYANGIEVSGYSKVLIEGNSIKNGPNFGIAIRSHQNNYTLDEFNWGDITIRNNEIDNYKQAIYVWNWPRANGFHAQASNINVIYNKILSSWNSMNQAHIHIIGEQYASSAVYGNEIFGGLYDVWSSDSYGVNVEGNWFIGSNAFNLMDYAITGGNLVEDAQVSNRGSWTLSSEGVYDYTNQNFVLSAPYAPTKDGSHDYFWSNQLIPVEAGAGYLYHANARVGSYQVKAAVMVQFRKADGSFHSNAPSQNYFVNSNDFEPIGMSFTVPEGAAFVKVSAYAYENEFSQDNALIIDDIAVHRLAD